MWQAKGLPLVSYSTAVIHSSGDGKLKIPRGCLLLQSESSDALILYVRSQLPLFASHWGGVGASLE